MQHLFRDPSSSTRTQRKPENPTQEEQNLPLHLKKLSRDLATIASQIPNKSRLSMLSSAMPKSLSSAALPAGLETQESVEWTGGYWSSPEDDDLLTNALGLTLQQQGGGDMSNESSPDEGPKTLHQAELRETASDTTLD